MIGRHCIRTWSTTQLPIALSSAEVEYYAMVEGSVKAIGLANTAMELGMSMEGPVRLHTDSASARAFAARRGVGRMRHIMTKFLWLQAAVQQRESVLEKV